MSMKRLVPGPGQESVWDYPRPPRIEDTGVHIVVVFHGVTIAETQRAKRVLETSHPPVYYIPPQDIRSEFLIAAAGRSHCEWKGRASHFNVKVGDRVAERAAWTYPNPTPAFAVIKDHVAFYAGAMDHCLVNGEQVVPQPGGFYGGWVTGNILGPFKGGPGTAGW
jgi:uncharacterized protein (DUF427 family)